MHYSASSLSTVTLLQPFDARCCSCLFELQALGSLLMALRLQLAPLLSPRPSGNSEGADPSATSHRGRASYAVSSRLAAALQEACGAALASPQLQPADPFRLLHPLHRLGAAASGDAWWAAAHASVAPLLPRMGGQLLANYLYLLAAIATDAESRSAQAQQRRSANPIGTQGQAGEAADVGDGLGFAGHEAASPGAGVAFLPPDDAWIETAFQRITGAVVNEQGGEGGGS